MRIIITRHGETIENVRGIIQGHLHGTLSDLGVEQAKKVALRLKDERLDYIFSSDLARAMDTAEQIREYHPDAVFSKTERLRETYLGVWQGKTREELGFTEDYNPPLPEDVETKERVYERAKSFLEELKQNSVHKNILLVGHNGINRAMVAFLAGKTYEEIKEIEHQHNTGVNIFELVDGVYQPIVLNCRKHLD